MTAAYIVLGFAGYCDFAVVLDKADGELAAMELAVLRARHLDGADGYVFRICDPDFAGAHGLDGLQNADASCRLACGVSDDFH